MKIMKHTIDVIGFKTTFPNLTQSLLWPYATIKLWHACGSPRWVCSSRERSDLWLQRWRLCSKIQNPGWCPQAKLWKSTCFHGFPWFSYENVGFPWFSMVFHIPHECLITGEISGVGEYAPKKIVSHVFVTHSLRLSIMGLSWTGKIHVTETTTHVWTSKLARTKEKSSVECSKLVVSPTCRRNCFFWAGHVPQPTTTVRTVPSVLNEGGDILGESREPWPLLIVPCDVAMKLLWCS